MDLFFGPSNTYQGMPNNSGAINNLRNKTTNLDAQVIEIARRTDRLALVCQALWEILYAKVGITPDELVAKMDEIDLRDGQRDGKITPQVVACAHCGRNIASNKPICMYCGTPLASSNLVP
jgi:hypothetical protein